MKRVLALVFLLLLLLTGCAGTPQSRESGATAVVSVLGVEPAGQGIHLLAAAEGRGEEDPFRCDSQGETPAAAVEGLTNRGEQVVSCAHVEHLLLTQNAAGTLPELLSYAFQEPQQSTETQLWVVRADTLEEAFSGKADTAKRMSVIKSQGKNRQGFCPVTLREAAAALARKEPLLLPALEVGEQGLAASHNGSPDQRPWVLRFSWETESIGPVPWRRRPWCCKAQAAGWSPRWRRDG